MKRLIIGVLFFLLMFGAVGSMALEWNGAVITLMNAAPATGDGIVYTLTKPFNKHVWHVIATGSPSSVSVTLQGSIDGTNWTTLDTSTTTTAEKRIAVNMPNLYIKANLGTLSGGTSPTITVKYLATD